MCSTLVGGLVESMVYPSSGKALLFHRPRPLGLIILPIFIVTGSLA